MFLERYFEREQQGQQKTHPEAHRFYGGEMIIFDVDILKVVVLQRQNAWFENVHRLHKPTIIIIRLY